MPTPARSIDAHAHWTPPSYLKILADLGRRGNRSGPPNPLMHDLAARVKWMDERSVQMHVLTLSGGMPWQWASQDQANRMARAVNDAAIEAHKEFPDRFIAGVAMPMRDPVAAMKELDRVAGEPGIRAVHMPNSVESHDYNFEPGYLPILAASEEPGYPLLFIPSTARTITTPARSGLRDRLSSTTHWGFRSRPRPRRPNSSPLACSTVFRSWRSCCRTPEG